MKNSIKHTEALLKSLNEDYSNKPLCETYSLIIMTENILRELKKLQ